MPILFVESKTLRSPLNRAGRTQLLQALQEKHLTPLIRSARLYSFEQLVLDAEHATAVDSAMADWIESQTGEAYVRGDIFSFPDHVFFLLFDSEGAESVTRAGIVYQAKTAEPFRKLDGFCHEVRDAVIAQANADEADRVPNWEQGKPIMPEGFKKFIARQETDSLYTSLRKETMSRRIVAASNLEHESAREFLRNARQAHMEGYAARLLPGDTAVAHDFSIENLENVGLIEREVQVSCRKTGHALFRLPNPHALAVVTVSDATCSECGSRVADERVEEVIAPTPLASSLLEDGSWLINRLHYGLRQLGVPESEIAVGPAEGTGYGQMMANICGESFLIVTRDGHLSPAFARWAIDLELETEASHLVVVATGKLLNEAGLLLHNHSRRRVSGGQDFELVVAGDITTAGNELRKAVERVSQRVIADYLCYLDSSFGLNVSRLLLTKFNLSSDEQDLTQHASVEEDEPATVSRAPLALAASASGDVADVIDVGELQSVFSGAVEPEIDPEHQPQPADETNVQAVWE